MAKKQRKFEPATKEDWKALTAWISVVCDLDKKKFRDEATRLADMIEREGHAAHRSADLLEGLSTFKYQLRDVKPSRYARSVILDKLKWKHDGPHLRLTEGRLNQLVEVGVREHLRQQAATLLDAAELIRSTLQWHAERLDKLWPSKAGRTPSVAKHEVFLKMLEWEVGATEMSQRLHEGGVRGKRFKPRTLTTYLNQHKK